MTIDEQSYGAPGGPAGASAGGVTGTTAGTGADEGGLKTQVKEQTRDLKDQVVDQTRQTIRQVADTAGSTVSESKRHIAGQVGSLARALHRTSEQLREENQPELARFGESVAQGIERVSRYLDEREPGELVWDVEKLAVRQPAVFVAGAFALGLVAGRFIKSSAAPRFDDDVEYTEVDETTSRAIPSSDPYDTGLPPEGRSDVSLGGQHADVW